MNYAAVAIPRMERLRMPLSRDQVVLLMAALNLFLLGPDRRYDAAHRRPDLDAAP